MDLKQRVEKEIETFKNELGKLSSYTAEIGKAKESAKLSSQIIEKFSALFNDHSELIENEFKELLHIKSDLEKLAQSVNSNTEKIKKVDFPDRLDRIEKSLGSVLPELNRSIDAINATTDSINDVDFPNKLEEINKSLKTVKELLKKLDDKVESVGYLVQNDLEKRLKEVVKLIQEVNVKHESVYAAINEVKKESENKLKVLGIELERLGSLIDESINKRLSESIKGIQFKNTVMTVLLVIIMMGLFWIVISGTN